MNKNHLANHMPSHTYYQPSPSFTAGKRVGLRETRLCSAKGRMALSCVLCTGAVPRSTARRRLYGDSSVQVLNELKRATLAGGFLVDEFLPHEDHCPRSFYCLKCFSMLQKCVKLRKELEVLENKVKLTLEQTTTSLGLQPVHSVAPGITYS